MNRLPPLTTLRFSSRLVKIKYKVPPTSATYEEQLKMIGLVSKKARDYIVSVNEQYSKLAVNPKKMRRSRLSLQEIAKYGPFVLAELLDIMADKYKLPIPQEVYPKIMAIFTPRERGSLTSTDAVLHKFLNCPPKWHLDRADELDRLAAYLDLDSGVRSFILGNTTGMISQEDHRVTDLMRGSARAIRSTYTNEVEKLSDIGIFHKQSSRWQKVNVFKDWKKQTKPMDFTMRIIVSRLRQYIEELTGHKGYRLIAALVQVAPYTNNSNSYQTLSLDTIRKKFDKGYPFPF